MKRSLLLLLLIFSLLTVSWAQDPVLDVVLKYRVQGKPFQLSLNGHRSGADGQVSLGLSTKAVAGGRMLQVQVSPSVDIELEGLYLNGVLDTANIDKLFSNGFQCWTTSKEYDTDATLKPLAKVANGIAQYYGDYTLYDYSKRAGDIHSWTYAYTRMKDGSMHFLGSVDESKGYTIVQYRMADASYTIEKEVAGKALELGKQYQLLKVFEANGADDAVFDMYAAYNINETQDLVKRTQLGEINKRPPIQTGWTSWYHYYTKIDQEIILENLNAFKSRQVPMDVFQIDDGYQAAVGDWTEANSKFPMGMAAIADSIHGAGYKAGIWLAPFIVERNSKIAKEHPEWLLQTKDGKLIKAGLNPGWSGAYYALNIYNMDVREHLKKTLDVLLVDWGYDMIKVDFLFAAAIDPPAGKTSGEVMTDAMLLLRDIAEDKWILGCGVPLGPSFHLVDHCRVSSDIHMSWEMKPLKWLNARERLSCWNSQTTVIARRQLSGRFFRNDPDAFVLRKEKNKLKPAQKHTMFLVNNLFGEMVMHSDNINKYDEATMNTYLSGFPFRSKQIHKVVRNGDQYTVSFSIADRTYMAFINLGKKAFTGHLPTTSFEGATGQLLSGDVEIGAFGSRCFYLVKGMELEVLGGAGHLFPGSEVKSLTIRNDKNLDLVYNDGAVLRLPVQVIVPKALNITHINGKLADVQQRGDRKVLTYKP